MTARAGYVDIGHDAPKPSAGQLANQLNADRLPVARCPEDARASTPKRARLHRPDVRQPRRWTLTAHPHPS